MKKFSIKRFAKWHKEKYGAGVYKGDICEYYEVELNKDCPNITQERFEGIVRATMLLNNY